MVFCFRLFLLFLDFLLITLIFDLKDSMLFSFLVAICDPFFLY
jgi:hypothetical protein